MINAKFTDKVIKCIDCAQDFPWTIGEQEFYAQKGLRSPIRCPMCRSAFKAAKEDRFRGRIENRN